MVKKIIGAVAGVFTAFILVMLVEGIGHLIWPPPVNVNTMDTEALAKLMKEMPIGALISVLVAWVVGAFGGGIVAGWLGRAAWPGFVSGGLLLAAAIVNLLMLPHPTWFWPGALIGIPAASLLGSRLGANFGGTATAPIGQAP